ncbi:MAG: SRPBCC domain-containing protein [Planctomycetes bacterium]|nr:SRPBCC domain-containing protein [Planctomycetota bacterium]
MSRVHTLAAVGVLALLALGMGMGKHDAAPFVGPTGEPQAVDASMFVGKGRDEVAIDTSVTVAAPRAEVYRRFTTGEGWKQFLGADAAIDLRIGGPWEIYFDPATKIGSNGCQVLSYVPDEMVSFSWNAPPKFEQERARRTWVVVTFADAGQGKTAVRLRHLGFTSEGNWPTVKEYFAKAWPNVLKALEQSYGTK